MAPSHHILAVTTYSQHTLIAYLVPSVSDIVNIFMYIMTDSKYHVYLPDPEPAEDPIPPFARHCWRAAATSDLTATSVCSCV